MTEAIQFIKLAMDESITYVIAISAVALAISYAYNKIKNRSEKKSDNIVMNGEIARIEDHSFFTKMKFFRESIKDLPIDNPIKKQMVVDFMVLKFEEFRNRMKKFVDMDIESLTEDKLAKIILLELYDGQKNYEYDAIKVGIPKVFIQKFNEWNVPRARGIHKVVEEIIKSNVYPDNTTKIYIILTFIEAAFYQTLIAANRVMNSFNGTIMKVKYKGKKIEDFE